MLEEVQHYLTASFSVPSATAPFSASSATTPFFVFVGDAAYQSVRTELLGFGLQECKTSCFCSGPDKVPNLDALMGEVRTSPHKLLVTGLGEYLALRGKRQADDTLARLKDMSLENGKVVLLLRGLAAQLTELQRDPRFDGRRFCVLEPTDCDLAVTLVAPNLGLAAISGFKALLESLETGRQGRLPVCTAVSFAESLCTVGAIKSAYDGVRQTVSNLEVPESGGTEAQWAELLAELNQHQGSLEAVFSAHGLDGNLEQNLSDFLQDQTFRNWLAFLCLHTKRDKLHNSYLRFALNRAASLEQLGKELNIALVSISPQDPNFARWYQERKKLVKSFAESDIIDFIQANNKRQKESICRLTDNTIRERQAVLSWIAQHGLYEHLENIYPDLADYLKPYRFKGTDQAELLTHYFADYRRQKVCNTLDPDFLAQVEELAHKRPFNRLPTREQVLPKLNRKDTQKDTLLYWLDALGVEYLAFMEAQAKKKKLTLRVHLARAALPTITSENRRFYDDWPGEKFSDKELDKIKHADRSSYDFTKEQLPIHLAKELEIIADVMEKAARMLKDDKYKRILIVSDHGTSRLAVLHNKTEKYETETQGKHSGRCCPAFADWDLPCATEENGWLVLADYGRFKGSRAADVEVHGGASLEEVVVPLIELSLKNSALTVEVVEKQVKADSKTGTQIELYFNHPVDQKCQVHLLWKDKVYSAEPHADRQHFLVSIPDINRAGEYFVEVHAGDEVFKDIKFKAVGKSATTNDEFDSLF